MKFLRNISFTRKYQCCPHIKTSQLICCANQLTGFYIRATLALNGLIAVTFLKFSKFTLLQRMGLICIPYHGLTPWCFVDDSPYGKVEYILSTTTSLGLQVQDKELHKEQYCNNLIAHVETAAYVSIEI